MPAKPTTNFTGLSVTGNDINSTNGLYVPKITSAQRDAINLPQAKKLGGIIYNLTTDQYEIFTKSGWVALNSASGGGDVSGPDESTSGAIAYFSDISGKKLASSGVTIDSISSFNQTTRNAGLELSGLTYLKFASDASAIYVDALTGIQFITNNFGADSQVCSLLTSGLPSSSSSPNALLEIQSTTGAFLMSRMSSAQRDALSAIDGMILYNTTSKSVEARVDDVWSTLSTNLNAGNVSGPTSAVSNNVAVFADSTGKVIADSSLNITVSDDNISISTAQTLDNAGNISLGTGSLGFVKPSTSNIGIGILAYHGGSSDDPEEATGEGNVAIGGFCMYKNGKGKDNVGIGGAVLFNLDDGKRNICVGVASGYSLNGSDNIMLGVNSGYYRSGDINCIYIGSACQLLNTNNNNLINSVAIGGGANVRVNNAMTLGKGINVGIGNESAIYALDIGIQNNTVPLIRMASTNIPIAPGNVNDGIYLNNQGQASYVSNNAIFSGNLVNAKSSNSASATCGFIQFLPGNNQGSVTVNTTAVKNNSIILTTLYSTSANGPSLTGSAIITNINPGVSFSAQGNYTPNGPTLSAFWLIINPS